MFLDKRLYVSHSLTLEYFVNCYQYTCFLYIAKAVIDGSAKELHCRREVHVSIDEWWYIESSRSDAAIEYAVVFLEVPATEYLCQFLLWRFEQEWLLRVYQSLLVIKMFFEEVEY